LLRRRDLTPRTSPSSPSSSVFAKHIDVDWYKSLQQPNVSITSLPLTSAGPKTVTLRPGRHYPPMSNTTSSAPTEQKTILANILIMANGYETGEWLHPLDVTGRNNQSLYDLWSPCIHTGTRKGQMMRYFRLTLWLFAAMRAVAGVWYTLVKGRRGFEGADRRVCGVTEGVCDEWAGCCSE
jgi:hypothetical protein